MASNNRENNFNLLRLLFASLVIVSHSPELVDGNRSREILTRIFGALTFGEVAVDGFFLISGYLIAGSYVSTGAAARYLLKRVLRIVPGYAVAFVICGLCIAPFVGGAAVWSVRGLGHLLPQMLTLLPPKVPGVFAGLPFPALNGAMWTIRFEFECYLMAGALGLMGLLQPRFRSVVAVVVGLLLLLNIAGAVQGGHEVHESGLRALAKDLRFFTIFGVGTVYWLFRDRISFRHAGAAVAASVLIGSMFEFHLAEAAIAVCGGYLIFWAAFAVRPIPLGRLTRGDDISYGLYLYGWPVQILFVWNFPTIDPWLLCALSLMIAAALGFISWKLVEQPSLRLVRRAG